MILSYSVIFWLVLLLQIVVQCEAFVLQNSKHQQLSATTNVFDHNLLRVSSNDDNDLGLKKIKIGDQDFWTRQKDLLNEMTESSRASLQDEMREKFAKRRLALVVDTAYFGFFIFCTLWIIFDNPFVAFSYAFGATMGLAYAYGLGRYVETLGKGADDKVSLQGAGLGEARFAFLILLFVVVGRFRDFGLQEIPSITGFFTYQLASLSQGLREIND